MKIHRVLLPEGWPTYCPITQALQAAQTFEEVDRAVLDKCQILHDGAERLIALALIAGRVVVTYGPDEEKA